ncbi:hypothetical protein IJH72_00455 [Candidatus Saccharibacteria bacterium]|nr:hypothetical protein [Candidatus Saccharibacteria bacterium]MBR0372404.1 hypothetical protein [Candidatus Saccharibacteria bacterium]
MKRNITFEGVVQFFITMVLIGLTIFMFVVLADCLERDDIESVITLIGCIIIIVPVIILMIKDRW